MIISECLTKQWSIKGIVFTNRAHEQIQISFRPFINLQHKKGKKNKNKQNQQKNIIVVMQNHIQICIVCVPL